MHEATGMHEIEYTALDTKGIPPTTAFHPWAVALVQEVPEPKIWPLESVMLHKGVDEQAEPGGLLDMKLDTVTDVNIELSSVHVAVSASGNPTC